MINIRRRKLHWVPVTVSCCRLSDMNCKYLTGREGIAKLKNSLLWNIIWSLRVIGNVFDWMQAGNITYSLTVSLGMLVGIVVRPLLEQSIEEERQLHFSGQLAARLIRRKTRTLPRLPLRPIVIVVTCCQGRGVTKSLSGNHSGGLSVFDKSFLTSLSSLVNYLSTLEIFSGLLRNIFTARRQHPSLSAAEL